MADQPLTARVVRGWAALPLSLRIGALYLLARLVTHGLLVLAAALAPAGSRFGPGAGVGDLLAGWDAQWYWLVAVAGYPTTLPLTPDGLVAENQWAFLPVYPMLANIVGAPANSWVAGAVVVSLVAGYGATYVLCRMLSERIGTSAAQWAAVMFACAPLAAIFHVGYAESLFLLLLFLALWAVQRRAYAWLYLLIPVMGFTRPGVLAFALFLALHAIARWVRRRTDPLPAREVVHIVATGLLGVLVGFSWVVIAGVVTGQPDAYLSTELAWRRNWLPDAEGGFLPFEGFVQAAAFWFTRAGLGAVAGYIALAASVVLVALVLWRERHVRRLGLDIRLWSASYLVYLLAVFFPQSSIMRLLLPLSPLWGAVALPRSLAWRCGVLAACLAGQWWWIHAMYALGNTFWRIP